MYLLIDWCEVEEQRMQKGVLVGHIGHVPIQIPARLPEWALHAQNVLQAAACFVSKLQTMPEVVASLRAPSDRSCNHMIPCVCNEYPATVHLSSQHDPVVTIQVVCIHLPLGLGCQTLGDGLCEATMSEKSKRDSVQRIF